ncbi:uncharacterized protein C8orf58 homolog isoform X2 [Octodon degus]|uniref:Uncharacterized protein C8orf58 homolog isoform X2 n=1 Tax=Octodon degus TaxID=10160 RepID=A0A6P6EDK3_OCTDE|nr:uncharacterized protein C8orf58 homolog isoform X2 [Octodon degus]
MLGRRRFFAVEPLGGQDRAAKALAHGCIVPGVTSTYRRIPDLACECMWALPGEGEPGRLERQVLLPKLASRDSGVEMVAEDSPPATVPGLSQDFLNMEPSGNPEPSALAAPEPTGQLGQLLASRKLEQVLKRSQAPPHLSAQHCAWPPLAPSTRPGCALPLLGARQEPTEADAEPEVEAEVVAVVPRAWACLPGQGLRYLEHLCLVLEQMARLQQLYLQLQTQRAPEEPEEEKPALAPSPSLSSAPGSVVWKSKELLSPKETEATTGSKVGMLSANPPRLPEAPVEPTDSFPPSQGHKDPSHWDKIKVLLNRIHWRSSGHPEPSVLPGACGPRTESRDLPGSPQCHPQRKTLKPSLVVKKQRAKNLSVC